MNGVSNVGTWWRCRIIRAECAQDVNICLTEFTHIRLCASVHPSVGCRRLTRAQFCLINVSWDMLLTTFDSLVTPSKTWEYQYFVAHQSAIRVRLVYEIDGTHVHACTKIYEC